MTQSEPSRFKSQALSVSFSTLNKAISSTHPHPVWLRPCRRHARRGSQAAPLGRARPGAAFAKPAARRGGTPYLVRDSGALVAKVGHFDLGEGRGFLGHD